MVAIKIVQWRSAVILIGLYLIGNGLAADRSYRQFDDEIGMISVIFCRCLLKNVMNQ